MAASASFSETVREIAAAPAVAEAGRAVAGAAAELRWHPALRRRAGEARTAAAIWTCEALADAAGLPPGGDLGERVAGGAAGEDGRWRTWRMHRRALTFLGDLGGRADRTAPPQILAALLRDGGAAHALRAGDRAGDLQVAARLMAQGPDALVATALSYAHLIRFVDPNAAPELPRPALATAAAKVHAVRSGLEHTGVAVVADPSHAHLDGYFAGDYAATTAWCEDVGQMLLDGVRAGRLVCDQVLAGRRTGAPPTTR